MAKTGSSAVIKKWTDDQTETLIIAYIKFNVPSDKIALDAESKEKFHASLSSSLRAKFGQDEVCKRLLSLRKSGKLPRLFR